MLFMLMKIYDARASVVKLRIRHVRADFIGMRRMRQSETQRETRLVGAALCSD